MIPLSSGPAFEFRDSKAPQWSALHEIVHARRLYIVGVPELKPTRAHLRAWPLLDRFNNALELVAICPILETEFPGQQKVSDSDFLSELRALNSDDQTLEMIQAVLVSQFSSDACKEALRKRAQELKMVGFHAAAEKLVREQDISTPESKCKFLRAVKDLLNLPEFAVLQYYNGKPDEPL
jgi:hypothetical protein